MTSPRKPSKAQIRSVERDVRRADAQTFLRTLSPITGNWNDAPRDWIFRGIGDAANWTLVPAALRQPPIPTLKYTAKSPIIIKTHSDQVDAEYGLLWEFFRVADGQGLLIPEDSQIYRSPWASEKIKEKLEEAKAGKGPWPFDEVMSLAALAQHHGVPTRLLDWSNDAFIAAYFAASEGALRLDRLSKGQCYACGCGVGTTPTCPQCHTVIAGADPNNLYLAVWCLNWRYLLERWPGDTKEEADDIEVLLVMAPRATNPNLYAQGGVFTVHLVKPKKPNDSIDRDPLYTVISRTAKAVTGITFPVMRCAMLPIRQADHLLRLLAAHRIHAASIFPGFDGVVRHLEEWRLWDELPPERDLPIN